MNRAKVCVAGANGRIGRRVVAMLRDHSALEIGALLEREESAFSDGGDDAVIATSDPTRALAEVEVLIDFSAPAAAAKLAPLCAAHKVAYVVASTGLSPIDEEALDAAARQVPVLQAANLSLGVNVLLELVQSAARRLPAFEVEISEIHHRHKKDAPSGTALLLGKAVMQGRGPLREVRGRDGITEPRAKDELGYAALRGGEVAGEHTVFLFGDSERLELTHRATSPDIFAHGALVAAAWLRGRGPGRYTMRDVLGV